MQTCPRCGSAPRDVTHVCPPPETRVDLSRLFAPRLGPPCPSCWRNDGGHSVGCPVEAYVEAWR